MFLFYKTIKVPTVFNFKQIVFCLLFITNCNLFAQELSLKGQLWGSVLRGNDPPTGRSNYEESWGYIPTFSFGSSSLSAFGQ